MADILFLRYPSEVSLIVSRKSRSLFHKDVWFICSEQGVYSFKDEKGNYFAYSPNKITLNDKYEIISNDPHPIGTDIFFTKIKNKADLIKIAQRYFKPLAMERDEREALVSLRSDDMGFYLS